MISDQDGWSLEFQIHSALNKSWIWETGLIEGRLVELFLFFIHLLQH